MAPMPPTPMPPMPPNIASDGELNFQKSPLIFYVNGRKVSELLPICDVWDISIQRIKEIQNKRLKVLIVEKHCPWNTLYIVCWLQKKEIKTNAIFVLTILCCLADRIWRRCYRSHMIMGRQQKQLFLSRSFRREYSPALCNQRHVWFI